MIPRDIDRRRQGTPLYFADDEGSVEPDRRAQERRASTRYRVHLWADQRLRAAEVEEVVHIPELSAEGAFVVRAPPLELGERVELELTLPQQVDAIRPVGRVASIRLTPDNPAAPSGYGVHFVELTDGDRARIAQYLTWVADASRARHPLAR